MDKSELIPMGEVDNVEGLAAELGCRVESLPSTYLGLTLGASHKFIVVWDSIEEKMRKFYWPPGREVIDPNEGG